MFDKLYYTSTRTEYVPYEKTIIEKRAPTDDSIKLYEEIKEKAYTSIVDTLDLRDNDINIRGIVYKDLYNYSLVCKFKFNINSKEIIGKVILEQTNYYDKYGIIREVYKQVSEILTKELIKGLEWKN